jgi:hypothetical protein
MKAAADELRWIAARGARGRILISSRKFIHFGENPPLIGNFKFDSTVTVF